MKNAIANVVDQLKRECDAYWVVIWMFLGVIVLFAIVSWTTWGATAALLAAICCMVVSYIGPPLAWRQTPTAPSE